MHKHLAQLSWRRFERVARSAAGRAVNGLSLSLPLFRNRLTTNGRQDAIAYRSRSRRVRFEDCLTEQFEWGGRLPLPGIDHQGPTTVAWQR